ncbi:MAG TPA: hypothetical protein VN671_11910 [Solirubrobacterales bacterium]|nr:hypothetical protein [Solirubrobacterales bacterium]
MRAIRSRVVAVLVGVVFAALGPATAGAAAEVLVSQPPGPSGVAVPSDGTAAWEAAGDDFDIPVHGHWHLEAIRVFGTATLEHPRTFNVRIYSGGGNALVLAASDKPVFSETVTVAGGPDYLIPIEGAPALAHGNDFEWGQWTISVQAQSAGEEDDWYWLTGADTAGNAPAATARPKPAGAEPGLAFELLGTATQIVTAKVSGAGILVSNPPGISCPGACTAEFPRGTALTFSASAQNTATKFIEWGFRNTGYSGPSGALSPIVIPSPCKGTGGCSFALAEDTIVGAVFEPIDEIDVLRVVRDRSAGKAQLLVWAPGPGRLNLFSHGLRSYNPGPVDAGVTRIPLIPTGNIAKTLRKKGRATVSAEVSFRATSVPAPTTVVMQVTLVRTRSQRPVHKPTHRVH